MTRGCCVLSLVAVMVAGGSGAYAQGPVPEKAVMPVQVQIVISRYDGDKKISSTPYSVSARPGSPRGAQLRLMTSVPIASPTLAPSDDSKEKPVAFFNYRDIGIQLDFNVQGPHEDGRYEVTTTISESSLATGPSRPTASSIVAAPALVRSYTSQNTQVLRNGQTSQYTAATDPVSGEVVRVDVTLTVPK